MGVVWWCSADPAAADRSGRSSSAERVPLEPSRSMCDSALIALVTGKRGSKLIEPLPPSRRSMKDRRFESRKTAHKVAVKLRPAAEDRLVLACASCPTTKPSKRRPPRWSVIARELAEAFGLKPAAVRERLTAALEAERGRAG